MKLSQKSMVLSSISSEILPLRLKMNILDQKIARALLARLQLSSRIGSVKKKKGYALYDRHREKEIIYAISQLTLNTKLKKYLSEIYLQLLKSSRQYQQKNKKISKIMKKKK